MEASRRRGRANEPSLFPFSSSSFLLLRFRSRSSFPSVDLLLPSHVCASTYPFRPFRWNGGGGRGPGLRPFRIVAVTFLALLVLPVSRTFLLLFFFPSCNYESFHGVASSAFNCRPVCVVDVRELLFLFAVFFLLVYICFILFLSSISFKLDKYFAPLCTSAFLNFFLKLFLP